jgi:hypothetical protein
MSNSTALETFQAVLAKVLDLLHLGHLFDDGIIEEWPDEHEHPTHAHHLHDLAHYVSAYKSITEE